MAGMYRKTNKSWNMAMKAYEQSNQTMARLDGTLDRIFKARPPALARTAAVME